jgi:hypothetical protein
MPKAIYGPFTSDQVAALIAFQASSAAYECAHHALTRPTLAVTPDGLVCPRACGYRREWVHAEALRAPGRLRRALQALRRGR